MSSKYRNFCITIFDYKLEKVTPLLNNSSKVKCYQYQEEYSEVKKRHIQLYMEFNNKQTFSGVKRYFKNQRIHVENRRGTKQQAVSYCMKSETRIEGTNPVGYNTNIKQGSRSALNSAIIDYINRKITKKDFLNQYPKYWLKSSKQLNYERREKVKENYNMKLKKKYEISVLHPWQVSLIEKLKKQSDRQILWIYEASGHVGKSWMAKYIYSMLEDVLLIKKGKVSDVVYLYNRQKYVCCDLARSQEGFVSYNLLEDLKDGTIFIGKYEPKMIVCDSAKVIVFANWPPETNKLSVDRWDIYEIVGGEKGHLEIRSYKKFFN